MVPKCPRHFGTGVEVSRIFTVVPKCPLDISALVPKCLGSEVSKVRSVRTPTNQPTSPDGRKIAPVSPYFPSSWTDNNIHGIRHYQFFSILQSDRQSEPIIIDIKLIYHSTSTPFSTFTILKITKLTTNTSNRTENKQNYGLFRAVSGVKFCISFQIASCFHSEPRYILCNNGIK